MSVLNDFEKMNLKWWNEVTPGHVKYYGDYFVGIEEFLGGKTTLPQLQIDEMGDVKGKILLHLQCHFGLDTLSWAREGASVTGIDFSEKSIIAAKELANKANIEADFVCCDVFDLKKVLSEKRGKFDIVYTSQGVLNWLKDIDEWGSIIAYFLKDGGAFYIQEMHPLCTTIEQFKDNKISLKYPYFSSDNPVFCPPESGDYVVDDFIPSVGTNEWQWSLGDIITSLCKAGLHIEFLHESDKLFYQMLPNMVKTEEGWIMPGLERKLPLSFSLKAIKQ